MTFIALYWMTKLTVDVEILLDTEPCHPGRNNLLIRAWANYSGCQRVVDSSQGQKQGSLTRPGGSHGPHWDNAMMPCETIARKIWPDGGSNECSIVIPLLIRVECVKLVMGAHCAVCSPVTRSSVQIITLSTGKLIAAPSYSLPLCEGRPHWI